MKGSEGCNGTEGLESSRMSNIFWVDEQDEFCILVLSSWLHPARSHQFASFLNVCHVRFAVASKQTVPEIYDLVEALAHPPFGSVKNLGVARDRWNHGPDGDVRIPESANEDSRGLDPAMDFKSNSDDGPPASPLSRV